MKNYILELLEKHSSKINELWISKFPAAIKEKFTAAEINNFSISFIKILEEIISYNSFKNLSPFLNKIYNLFSEKNLTLTEISRIFRAGQYSIYDLIRENKSNRNDFIEEYEFIIKIFDELFVRFVEYSNEELLKSNAKEREHLLKKLEVNRQYLQNILHYSDSAIMVIDDNEEFIAWNRGAEKIFGYSQKEVIGKKSSFLLPEGEQYETELAKIIDDVNSVGFSKIIETERKTKNNKIIPVQLNVVRLPGENNKYAGRTVVITDVTEVRKLKQQIDQSEKLAVIGQLAAGVAHEIGNPLASISSIVQILQRKSSDQFISKQLVNVKDNINRISKIVRELVDLSRPPSHDELFTQVSEVIKTALGIVKYDKRVKKVEFKTELNNNLPMVKIVPDQLLQVFINILINALDAIEGEGTIIVKSRYDDNYIYINIIDNGVGIDEEAIDKVFDPFYTTKQVGKGTGLGLSVSYGIIKKINGDITIKSKLGEGSDFQVQIPIHAHIQDSKIEVK